MKHQIYFSDNELLAVYDRMKKTRGGFNRWLIQAAREKLRRDDRQRRLEEKLDRILAILAQGVTTATPPVPANLVPQEEMGDLDWGV